MLKWNQLEGKLINNKYEVKKTIGEGGAGKIYLATDIEDGKQVAIKASNPYTTMSNYKERFRKEAKILSKLSNPNIIAFYEYISIDDIDMIVMEYVEGISLENKLRQKKTLPVEEVLNYSKQILNALSAVHSHAVYHRDVKTDNIQITVDGTVKLLDFGIIQETMDQDLTRQGSVIGTVSYLAPELITEKVKKANPRTDIYSLGVMLYQLLTGVKPFKSDPGYVGSEKQNNLARKIVYDPVVPLIEIDPSISPEVNHFVMKMLEKKPEDRYQNTNEALADLEKISKGSSLEKLQGYYPEETKEYSMKKQIIMISVAIGIFFLLLVVLLIAFLV